MNTSHDIAASQIWKYSDAVEAPAGSRWLAISGTPGLLSRRRPSRFVVVPALVDLQMRIEVEAWAARADWASADPEPRPYRGSAP